MIQAEGLRKRYGPAEALRGVDLDVPQGSVCGLLGPNGAGKTTLVRILTTLLRPDGGSARVAGCDVVRDADRLRYRIGLAGQHAALDELLTGRGNLELFGRLHHLPRRTARSRAGELLERFGLTEAADRPAGTYSGGMRRRLDLAASLVVAPPVLFLDEPTTGLDPRSRLTLWDLLRELAAEGTTLLLTTQYLDEADRLADRVAVLDAGRVVASGSPAALKARVGGDRLYVAFREAADLARGAEVVRDALPSRGTGPGAGPGAGSGVGSGAGFGKGPTGLAGDATGIEIDRDERRLAVPVPDGAASLVRVASALNAAGVAVEDLGLRRPTLDEVFLRLTGADAA
ncbi:daunorubicin resistance protein DrrA family ABC transporter ATP-binding protein [Microbispora amethystogenes]|uniref:Daunorubicin resistance protein DrrA family ABC transporter ATP-binding protein n=1 Tax=Microbispora amethystogenes TaxID=1427754 RepID=A0ABQ4FDL3_9ACTN|nr:ATP-binding cassette domain-containing protein [Microbispora amethystogenes]GIH32914.1 daunorubicin resistance protein DrrA family ABC transporter ATP-binding protein [Microbispora amethystogenes]